jgi:hypothetical protein
MTDDRPIVVGGCHRSGTSLVRRLLDSHSRIHCGPELKFMLEFHRGYAERDPFAHLRFAESARSVLPEEELFELLGAAFLGVHERAARRAGKPRWADKAPENVLYLDAWEKLLGEKWIFVHVVRDPLDTLASIQESPFPLSVPSGLEARIDHYLRYMEAGLEFGRRHPDRCLRVAYERLVADPAAEAGALMAGLGESFEPAQLELDRQAHQPGLEDPKIDSTARIHEESVGRWREAFDAAQARLIRARTEGVWGAVG